MESIRIISNYDKSVKNGGKSTNYFNLRDGIALTCKNGWVKNCTIMHVWLSAISSRDSQNCTIRDCNSLKPVGPISGGKRYSYNIGGSTCILYFNCFAEDGRHDFAVGARTTGPNAYIKCTAIRGGQSEPHARWGVGTLYDRITLKESGSLAAVNRGNSGSGHGWAAANTVIWNASAPAVIVANLETIGENNFAIGYAGPQLKSYSTNSLWYANMRAGYWRTPNEGKYFGHALMGNGHIESPDKPVKPDSLFIHQLTDRFGEKRAQELLK